MAFGLINICNIYRLFIPSLSLSFSLFFPIIFIYNFIFSRCLFALLFNINLQINEIVIHSLIFYDSFARRFSNKLNYFRVLFTYHEFIPSAFLRKEFKSFFSSSFAWNFFMIQNEGKTFISTIFHLFKTNKCPSTNSINIQEDLFVALLGFDFFGKNLFNLLFWQNKRDFSCFQSMKRKRKRSFNKFWLLWLFWSLLKPLPRLPSVKCLFISPKKNGFNLSFTMNRFFWCQLKLKTDITTHCAMHFLLHLILTFDVAVLKRFPAIAL